MGGGAGAGLGLPAASRQAHWPIHGSTLTVTIHRDHIDVHAEIIPDEIEIMQKSTGNTPADKQQQVSKYGQYLLSHLHLKVEGVELKGKMLKASRPDDELKPGTVELVYGPPGGGGIWPRDVAAPMLAISHNLMDDRQELFYEFVQSVTYTVAIAQDGDGKDDGLLLNGVDPVTFICHWSPVSSAPATTHTATQATSEATTATAPAATGPSGPAAPQTTGGTQSFLDPRETGWTPGSAA